MTLEGKSSDGWVSKYLNRPISIRISRLTLAMYPSTTPTFFTILTLVLGLMASTFLLMRWYFISAIAYQACSILDGCDGEIARHKNLTSKKGDFLDSVIDRIIDTIYLTSLGLVLFIDPIVPPWLLLTWLVTFIALSYLISYTDQNSKRLWDVGFKRTIEGRDARVLIVAMAVVIYPRDAWISFLMLVTYTMIVFIFFAKRVTLVLMNKWPP